jgi:hypothetical protein
MKKPNVFISWSGDRSKLIAEAFREWLPMVIQSAKPWMSSANIDKGSRGLLEMAKALDGIKVGISCLTPENLTAPWILFEAGSLAKTIDDSTRLCTYLLGGLTNENIEPPLGQFQHTSPNKEDTRSLVRTINKAVGEDDPLPEKTLDAIFDRCWPVLEEKLQSFPQTQNAVTKRPVEDMLAEILEFTRAETNRRSSVISMVRAAAPSPQTSVFYTPSPSWGEDYVQLDPSKSMYVELVPKRKSDEPDKKS